MIVAKRAQIGAWGDDALSFAKDVGKDVVASTVSRILGVKPGAAPQSPPPKPATNWPLIIGGGAVGVVALVLLLRR